MWDIRLGIMLPSWAWSNPIRANRVLFCDLCPPVWRLYGPGTRNAKVHPDQRGVDQAIDNWSQTRRNGSRQENQNDQIAAQWKRLRNWAHAIELNWLIELNRKVTRNQRSVLEWILKTLTRWQYWKVEFLINNGATWPGERGEKEYPPSNRKHGQDYDG